MSDYSQPDFYRFNEDSLELVRWVSSRVSKAHTIADLGAGSGIIGIELANRLNASQLTLVEMQPEYFPHLNRNIIEQLNSQTKADVCMATFSEWKAEMKYDLIVCNPPYYLPGHGVTSPDLKRSMARTFITDDWTILLNKIRDSLITNGSAFLVIKSDPKVLEKIERFSDHFLIKKNALNSLLIIELARLNID